jgi:hypothetical protein
MTRGVKIGTVAVNLMAVFEVFKTEAAEKRK